MLTIIYRSKVWKIALQLTYRIELNSYAHLVNLFQVHS
jgi:hypothetical protein